MRYRFYLFRVQHGSRISETMYGRGVTYSVVYLSLGLCTDKEG